MALTLKRWLVVALVAFGLVPLVLMGNPDYDVRVRDERQRLQSRANLAEIHASREAERSYLMRLMDSVRRVTAAPGAPALMIDRRIDSTRRAALVGIAGEALGTAPKPGIAVVMLLDTAQREAGLQRQRFVGSFSLEYLLPASAGDRCVVVARLAGSGNRDLPREALAHRLLGPCAFYQAFGMPGPQVAAWLRSGGWLFAQNGEWTDERTPLVPPTWFLESGRRYGIRQVLTFSGLACLQGRDAACLQAFAVPDTMLRLKTLLPGVISTARFNASYYDTFDWYASDRSLGPSQWTLLSDMVRALGPDKFAAFWRSQSPPAEAFQSAAGESLPDWMRDWMKYEYQASDAGGDLGVWTAALAALVIALAVAIAVRAASARQVA